MLAAALALLLVPRACYRHVRLRGGRVRARVRGEVRARARARGQAGVRVEARVGVASEGKPRAVSSSSSHLGKC